LPKQSLLGDAAAMLHLHFLRQCIHMIFVKGEVKKWQGRKNGWRQDDN